MMERPDDIEKGDIPRTIDEMSRNAKAAFASSDKGSVEQKVEAASQGSAGGERSEVQTGGVSALVKAAEDVCAYDYADNTCTELQHDIETLRAAIASVSDAAQAVQVPTPSDANIITGAMAIARSRGHDPDEPAPLTEMCTDDNAPVPWWVVFMEESEACLKAVSSVPSADCGGGK